MATHPSQRDTPLPMIPGMVNDPLAGREPMKPIAKDTRRGFSDRLAVGVRGAVKARSASPVRMAVNDAAPRSWPHYPQVTPERASTVEQFITGGRPSAAFATGFEKRAGMPSERLSQFVGGPNPQPKGAAERLAGFAGRFAGTAIRPDNFALGLAGGAVVGKAAKYAAPYAKKAARYVGGKAIDYGMAGEGVGRKAFGSLGGAVKRATGETAEKFATGGRFELASTAPKPRPRPMRPRDVGATDAWAAALNDTTPGAAARLNALDTPAAREVGMARQAAGRVYRQPGPPAPRLSSKETADIVRRMEPTPPVGGGPGYQSRMLDRGAQAIEKAKKRATK